MSRVGGGDADQKVESESGNSHRLDKEAAESLTGAGMDTFFSDENPDPFLEVKDNTNIGASQGKIVNLK